MNLRRSANHEAVAHPVERAEHQQRAGALVRQAYFLAEAHPGSKARVAAVLHEVACLVDGHHVARDNAVAAAAVDDNHLVLADQLRAVDHRDDAALQVFRRRAQDEIERRIRVDSDELVALERFTCRVRQHGLRRIRRRRDRRGGGVDAFIAEQVAALGIANGIANMYDAEAGGDGRIQVAHVDVVA